MAKKRRKTASRGTGRRSGTGYLPWPFMPPLDPKLRDATARLFMSRVESWGKTLRAMADIADQMEREWNRAGGTGRSGRTPRGTHEEW